MVTEKGITTNGNVSRGPTTLDLGSGYSADTYYKSSYITEQAALAQVTELLVIRSGLWTPEVARQMVKKGFDNSDPQNTSWIGFRKLGAPRDEYVGLAWQQEINIPTVEGTQRLLYLNLRAFEPEAQRKHLGRTAIQLALNIYPEVQLIAHRSGSPAAVYSFLESGVFKEGKRYPYDMPFDKAPMMPQILLWVYSLFHINGKSPNLSTGVSIADYIEPNKAYIPDLAHGPTMAIREWMEGKLKMKLDRGDALYEIGEVA